MQCFSARPESNQDSADVAITVRSAYEKDRIVKFASPVHFTKLIEATAAGKRPQLGPRAQVKRR